MNDNFYIKGIGLQYGEQGLGDFAGSVLPSVPHAFDNCPPLPEMLPGLNLRRASAVSRLALGASAQAMLGAGLTAPLGEAQAQNTGLYIGSSLGAAGSSFAFMDSILDGGAQLASPTHFSHSVNNVFCGFLSMSLNIQGPSCTVCQFGLSFAGAQQSALGALALGEIDLALVGAVEQASEQMCLVGRHAAGSDSNKASHPHETPDRDCAVFFLISRESKSALARISMPEWECGSCAETANAASAADSARPGPYRNHPAVQALKLAAAMVRIAGPQTGTPSPVYCKYTDAAHAASAGLRLSPLA